MARAATRRAARSSRWAERIALREIGLPGARRRAKTQRAYAQAVRGWGTGFDPTFIDTIPPWLAREAEVAPVEPLQPFVGPRPSATIIDGWGAFAGVPGSAPVARTRAGALSRASGLAPPRGFTARRAAAPSLVSLSTPYAGTPSQVSFAPSSIARPMSRTVAAMQRLAMATPAEAPRPAQTPLARAESRTTRTPALARGLGQTLAPPSIDRAIARSEASRPTGRGFEVSRAVSRRAAERSYSAPELALPQAPAGFGLTHEVEPATTEWTAPAPTQLARTATIIGLADSATTVARQATSGGSTAVTAAWSSAPLDPSRPVRTSTSSVARSTAGVARAAASPLVRVAERARTTYVPGSPAARIAARAGSAAPEQAPAYALTRRTSELPTASAPAASGDWLAPAPSAPVGVSRVAPLQRIAARSTGTTGPTAVREATRGLGRRPAVLSSSVLAVAAPAPEAFLDALAGEPAASPAIESARPLTRARRTAAPVPTSSATTAATTAALARASAPLATGGSGPARSTAVTAASPQALARSTATRAATSGSLPGSTAITAGAGEAFAGSTAPTGSAAYGEYVPASRAVSRTGVARSSAVTALARALAAQPGQAAVAGGAIGRAAARADAAQPAFATALASTSPVARSVARSAPAPAPALRRLPWASAGSDLPLPQMPSMAAEPVVEPVPVQAPTRTASRSEAPSVRTPAAPLPGPSAPLARAATGPASSTAVTAGAAGAVARSSATVAQAGAGTFAGQSPLHRTADAAWMGAPVARRTTSSPASRALSRAEAPQAAPGTSESPTHRSTRHSGTPAVRAIARFGLPGSSAPTGRSVARSLSVAAGLGKLPSVTSGGDLADRLAPGIRRSRLIAPEAIVAQLPDPSAQVPEVEPTVAAPVARRAAATPATTASPATLPRSTATVARSATGVARSSAITASAQIADRRAAEATTRSPLSRAFQRAGVGEGPTSATPPQGSSATVARASRRVAAPERSLAHPRPLTGRSIDPVLPQLTLPWSGTESTAEVAVPMGGLPSASAPVAGPSEPAARSTASSSVTRALARAEAPTGGPVALHEGGPLVRRPGYRPALSRGELPALAGFPAFAQEPAGVDSTSVTAAGARPAARSTARTAGQIQTSAGSTARTASPGRAASRSTARTAGPVQRRAHIGAPTATLPSLHRLASSATTADSATGPARSTARTAGRVEPRGLFRALQRDADVAVGIAAHSTLVAPDLIHSTAPEALLASEVVGEVQAESAPLRRRSGRSSIARPSTTLPRRFARRAEATALTAPYARGVARSSAVVATVADLRTGDGFPDIETGSSDSQPVADASGMVSRAARRLRSTAPRASRRAALTSELPRTSAPGVTVSRKELTRLVRKEMTELTTISAPAPTVHRSQVNRGLAEEIRRESAPTTQQSGAGASTKDLEDFLKRAVRRMLKEEAIRSERDLTPWD